MAIPLYGEEATVIQKTISIVGNKTEFATADELLESYDVEEIANVISAESHKKVALQFPDHLLPLSASILKALQQRVDPSISFAILGDTSYGSCCCDEIGAEHMNASLIVHYGLSCLSPTSRIKARYVFGRQSLDKDDFINNLVRYQKELEKYERVVVMYDVFFRHYFIDQEFQSVVQNTIPNVLITSIPTSATPRSSSPSVSCSSTTASSLNSLAPSSCNSTSCCVNELDTMEPVETLKAGNDDGGDENSGHRDDVGFCGRQWDRRGRNESASYEPLRRDGNGEAIIFIGEEESETLTTLLISFANTKIYSYSAEKKVMRTESGNVNRTLQRRFYLIEKAKDAQTIGIVVGTLGVEKYREGLEQLKKEIKKRGRKGYVFVVGKLNVPKLANFPEIECFVMLSCPLHSLVDSKEYLAPIITPFELLLALRPPTASSSSELLSWNGTLITDFRQLLVLEESTGKDGKKKEDDKDEDEDEDEDVVHQSLFTNRIKSFKPTKSSKEGTEPQTLELAGDIVVRDEHKVILHSPLETFSTGAIYLSQRTFRGLDTTQGDTSSDEQSQSFTVVTSGLSGIPMHYANDLETHK